MFSAEHPVFTSYGSQDWYYDEDGEILHFPVDRYFLREKGCGLSRRTGSKIPQNADDISEYTAAAWLCAETYHRTQAAGGNAGSAGYAG